ncbi:MAG: LysR family transcriptional regulator [Acidimicrobiales bacterium]
MAAPDWLRTFVAVYRAGSVSGGAARRGLSQSAASQQLGALERRVGLPVFARTPTGVEPTRRGRELYAEVADSLDRLEHVLAGLDAGTVVVPDPPLRIGSSAEFFAAAVVPRLGPGAPALAARFGPDAELLELLEHGELDVAVTSSTPTRRSLASTSIGTKRFVLVGPPGSAPDPRPASLVELGDHLVGSPWVAYSTELPMTRRFWQSALGRPFAGDLRLVAPDLRAVAAAVEHGIGVSLLPDFACADALRRGAVVEVHPVADVVPAEPWFACTRAADLDRSRITGFVAGLAGPGAP